MGRWAQASRRGGGIVPAAAIGPPPAPLLDIVEGRVLQLATGGDDTGGICELQFSPDGEEDWEQFDVLEWVASADWGSVVDREGFFWRAREIGNDVAYTGPSTWSAILDLV